MLFNLLLLAQGGDGGGGGGGGQAPPMGGLMMPIAIIGLMFLWIFLVARPKQMRQEQERQALLGSTEKNDEILTVGGIFATVVSVNKEADEMIVKIEDNAKMKIQRSSVLRNITKEKEQQARQQATTEGKK
jgi:preprotein translocase subunit YajC